MVRAESEDGCCWDLDGGGGGGTEVIMGLVRGGIIVSLPPWFAGWGMSENKSPFFPDRECGSRRKVYISI